MKFNVNWLADIVGQSLHPETLADALTSAGLEVDSVTPAADEFTGVVVARITQCEQHPDADKLRLCQVDYGQAESVQIVCGAPNARTGLVAPLATVGAVLPGNFKIKPAKLRGIESQGMLCSGKELGLDEDASGLMELPEDALVGENLRNWLDLDDTVIELDLTPNRADCLSLRGLAREVSAIKGQAFKFIDSLTIPSQTDTKFQISIENFDDCPRYAGRIIENIDPQATSPVWMQERLRRCGLRSKSPLVDVTNYILLEMGQPLHAFDLDRLKHNDGSLPVIGVRRAKAGEKLTLLNEQVVNLTPKHLIITADDQPEATAGLMGGLDTAVTDDTTSVLLESAWFSPRMIMGRARNFGVTSDAAHRFERGIDPSMQLLALERATELLTQIAGGQPGPICVLEQADQLPQLPRVRFRLSRCNGLLGLDLKAETVTAILSALGMQVESDKVDSNVWHVTPPAARLDIELEVDLIEEIARIHGFEHIPDQLPAGALSLQPKPEAILPLKRVESLCVDLGYQQAITYSFVERNWLQPFGMAEMAIELANPISQELAVMRPALVPGLVAAVQRNLRKYTGQQRGTVRLFEIGTVFAKDADAENIPVAGYKENQRLGLAACGRQQPEQWQVNEKQAGLDFYAFKGDVEAVLGLTKGELSFQVCGSNSQRQFLHPGQSADILLATEGNPLICIGWMGLLHPGLRKKLGLDAAVYVAELDLDKVRSTQVPNFQKSSKFPAIRRDLALIVPESVSAQQVLDCVRKHAGEYLKSSFLFDVYQGAGVESGYKSLAIGLILQDDYQTLTDETADENETRVLSGLKQDYDIRIRD